jgi:hypothetical protein
MRRNVLCFDWHFRKNLLPPSSGFRLTMPMTYAGYREFYSHRKCRACYPASVYVVKSGRLSSNDRHSKKRTLPARTVSVLLNMLSLSIATSSNPLPRARADSVFCGCHRRPLGLNNPRNFTVCWNTEWQQLSDSWASIQDSKFKHSQLWCC